MTDPALQKKINDLVVSPKETLKDVINKMDNIRKKLLIVKDQEQFINIISIGDIQRHLIKHQNFNAPVQDALRDMKGVIWAKPEDSVAEIKREMLKIRAVFMPVLDDNNNLVTVHFWEDFFDTSQPVVKKNLNLDVVIMAGGIGSRLKPITNIIPKPLIPIGEKPIVEHIMDRFHDLGSRKFYFTVNYKAEVIKNYFDGVTNKDYSIEYFHESKPLGTGGSLHMLKSKINSTFFVSNCDIIIEQDYSEIYDYHIDNKNEITLVAAIKYHKIPYGTLTVGKDGLLEGMIEKPEYTYMVNAGLYLIEPHLLNEIPENEFFHITHLVEKIMKRNGRVGVFPVSEKSWADIGNWNEYKQTLQRYGYESW